MFYCMRMIHVLILLLLTGFHAFSANKCPHLTHDNILSVWEGWSSDDICYLYMDLTDPDDGLFSISYWRDSTYTVTFRLVQKQIRKGSITLFFESPLRASSDKVIMSGEGTVCDSTGSINAEVQLLFKRNIINKEIRLVFHRRIAGKPSAVDLLETIAGTCRKETKKFKTGK